jgi:hypothetical protein
MESRGSLAMYQVKEEFKESTLKNQRLGQAVIVSGKMSGQDRKVG